MNKLEIANEITPSARTIAPDILLWVKYVPMAWQIPLSAVFLSKNSVESAYKNTSHELNTRISINNSVFSWCIINSTIQNNPIQKTQYETTQYKKQYETTQYKTTQFWVETRRVVNVNELIISFMTSSFFMCPDSVSTSYQLTGWLSQLRPVPLLKLK